MIICAVAAVILLVVTFFRQPMAYSLFDASSTQRSVQQASSKSPLAKLFNASESDQWTRELMARLDRIREACGELCNINDKASLEAYTVKSSKPQSFRQLRVPHVNCDAIIGSADMDATDYTTPEFLPKPLIPYFTVDGLTKYKPTVRSPEHYNGNNAKTTTWTKEALDDLQKEAMVDPPLMHGTYGRDATKMVREKLRQLNLNGKSVLVIGSETPWVEVLCLGLGAAQVTTLEYGRITSTHPQVKALTPTEFREQYQRGKLELFDVVASHSSLEHSGLGRYGDGLNPWGDILAVARAWCVTKPGGGLYLGLPTGKDDILHNAHKVYGKVRWPLVSINYQQLDYNEHTEEEFQDDITMEVKYGGSGFIFEKI